MLHHNIAHWSQCSLINRVFILVRSGPVNCTSDPQLEQLAAFYWLTRSLSFIGMTRHLNIASSFNWLSYHTIRGRHCCLSLASTHPLSTHAGKAAPSNSQYIIDRVKKYDYESYLLLLLSPRNWR